MTRAAAGLNGSEYGSSSVADVNRDGNLDLLITGITEEFDASTTLYFGNGDGTFSKANANLKDAGYSATAIADVNGDENPDLLIAGEADDGTVSTTLYLGDGNGDFTVANANLTGVRQGAVAIRDIDGNGTQDILLTGKSPNNYGTATLYLGNGDASFSPANAGLTGVQESAVAVSDLDDNGHQDFIISGRYYDQMSGNTYSTTVYLGQEDGSFTEAGAGLTGVDRGDLSVADVNEDGHQDLLLTGYDTSPGYYAARTTLYLGNGDGSFSEANANLANVDRSSTTIADLNGDDNLDLLLTGRGLSTYRSASLYLGDGKGGFSEVDAGLTGVQYGSAVTADIGNDGDQDLLITGSDSLSSTASARLYVNRTNQSPPNRSPKIMRGFDVGHVAAGVPLRRTIEAGDPDGDRISFGVTEGPSPVSLTDAGNGFAKIEWTPTRQQGGKTIDLRIGARDPAGQLSEMSSPVTVSSVMAAFQNTLPGVFMSSSSIADVNGDGHLDVLLNGGIPRDDNSTDNTASLFFGNQDGTFSAADAQLKGGRRGATSIADFNTDGDLDLLISGENNGASTRLYLGDGTGAFSEMATDLTDVSNGSHSVADVNDDNVPDILLTGEGEARLHLGTGTGSFTDANANLSGVDYSGSAIGDVNTDGHPDLLVVGESNYDPSATLYLGRSDGSFEPANANLTAVERGAASIADVNADGTPDILITGRGEQGPTATLHLGDGSGGFSKAQADLSGVSFSASSIADVNGDGHLDLLISGIESGGIRSSTLYLGDGTGAFSEATAGLAGVMEGSISTGDVDDDQDLDVLITGYNGQSQTSTAILYENLFGNPIPVELASFDARTSADGVALSWTTASETNNAGFRIQRRVASASGEAEDPDAWTTVDFVDGAGTTSQTQHYRRTDATLPYAADALTYRLKQIDTDGSTHYSKAITVERSVSDVELRAPYPNPTRTQATVRYAIPEPQQMSSGVERPATLTLYDVLGREVRTVAQSKTAGRHEQRLNVNGLPSGVYFLRLQTETTTRTQRMTIVQ